MPAKLTKSLITEYAQAISLELLPQSFEDAIEITRRLGYQYLWIDALCIIQDDADDWEQEAPMMTSYYGLSSLMISATAAINSCEGILIRRNVLFSPGLGQDKSFYFHHGIDPPHIDIAGCILSTRGWAAQERMLAPRIIHYTRQQMIWECSEELVSEAWGPHVLACQPQCRILSFKKSWLQESLTKAFVEARRLPSTRLCNAPLATYDEGPVSLKAWHECVCEYSRRRLTMPSDKLHAIAGVASLLNDSGELGHYLAGIWSEHLVDHLAWSRRGILASTYKNYRAPSWSWASLDSEVTFVNRGRRQTIHTSLSNEEKEERAKMFDIKLKEHHMILRDKRNIYGAVLECSYITVEGACITREALDQLLIKISTEPSRPDGFKKNRGIEPRSGSRYFQWKYRGPTQYLRYDEHKEEDITSPYQFCMYLMISSDRIEALLLTWVNREERVARRVGRMALREHEGEYFDHYKDGIHTDDWQRWTVKLV